jgi:hypothetical protein
MKTIALRKKIIDKIENSDTQVLQIVLNILSLYNDREGNSAMTDEQKMELDQRDAMLEKGLIKKRSIKSVSKSIDDRLKSIYWLLIK